MRIGKAWFTSDLLLGSERALQERDRPFTNVDEMNESIIDAWNELVRPDDVVWILGGAVSIREDGHLSMNAKLALLTRLQGTKYLLAGSGDACLPGRVGWRNWADIYREVGGLKAVITGEAFLKSGRPVQIPLLGGVGHGHMNALLSPFHYPLDAAMLPDQFKQHRPQRNSRSKTQATALIHGYAPWVIHKTPGPQLNVSMDAWPFEPVPADVVASLLTDS
jgi:calcineurin-like phosphoesterase family protein